MVWEGVHLGAGLRLLRGGKHEVGQGNVPFAVILLVLSANKPEGDMSQRDLGSSSTNCWNQKPPRKGCNENSSQARMIPVLEESDQETNSQSNDSQVLGSCSKGTHLALAVFWPSKTDVFKHPKPQG